jgi:hypothetical protein
MSAFYDQASLVVVPSGYKSGKIYAQKPLTTDGQLTFTRASTATRVNASGLIEAVSSGVPRLDYLGSTCPKLLLEPQRTNSATFSEQFDNAAFSKYKSTVTANDTTSPDGTANADFLVENTDNDEHSLSQTIVTTNAAWTMSVFAKPNGRDWISLSIVDGTNTRRNAYFNIASGAVGTTETGMTASIVDYGNGWYRCIATIAVSRATNAAPSIALASADNTKVYTGNGTSGAYIYGFQVELGAYETSLIPTLGTSVTRVADAAHKTGIGSLFGASAGTIYFETTYYPESNTGSGERWVYAQGATSADYIRLWQDVTGGTKRIRALVGTGGVQQVNISALATALGLSDTEPRTIKFAFAYANNDFRMYVNGNKQEDTAGTAPTITEINFNNTFQTLMPLAQCLVFPTALTNAQLAELTTL